MQVIKKLSVMPLHIASSDSSPVHDTTKLSARLVVSANPHPPSSFVFPRSRTTKTVETRASQISAKSTRAFAVKGVRRSIVSPSSRPASQYLRANPSSGAYKDVDKVLEHVIEVNPLDEGEVNSKESDGSDVFKSSASKDFMPSLCVSSMKPELAPPEWVGETSTIEESHFAIHSNAPELSHNDSNPATSNDTARLRAISTPAVLASSSHCEKHSHGESSDKEQDTTVILEDGDVTPLELINKATHLKKAELGPGLVNDIDVLIALATKLGLKSVSTSKNDVPEAVTMFSLDNSPSLFIPLAGLTSVSTTTTKKGLATLLAMMPALEVINITTAMGHEDNDYSLDAAFEVASRLAGLQEFVLTIATGEQITGGEVLTLDDKLSFLTIKTPSRSKNAEWYLARGLRSTNLDQSGQTVSSNTPIHHPAALRLDQAIALRPLQDPLFLELAACRSPTGIQQPKEHSLLENAWRIPAGDELTYVTRALDYIRNERPDIAEVLEDDPELAPGKLIQAIKRSLLIQREGDAAMQIVRDEVGDLAAQDWSVRPEDCDRVKELLKIAKEKVFAKYATDDTRVKTEKMWPFS
ncbi:hypothetical protein AUEXF2481DRAFT_32916 [Aureobasidium subglaciale EXF-2481]|uniref:Uncharacterized protein n=1 Tax=Aureobasidium subglaciale (strain EXF-2481) TaxID=1043005 RepID=A0A074Y1C1_AURSE|nr:uncharacterized protein AUEXF2481DRAFT_32916 [Aureobasidium subglaciale EXF-2481]KEQ91530.1 hypothetical protein AUEXF2481DRAFT_32916 [Aureobasidium subglaciale EXF-2481]